MMGILLHWCVFLVCFLWLRLPDVDSFAFNSRIRLTPKVRTRTAMSTVPDPVCKLEKVLMMFLSNPNITEEIRQKKFTQTVKLTKKPLPSFLSPDDELVLADIVAQQYFFNKSMFFTNLTMSTSIEVFDEEYDALGKDRNLPVFNNMLRRFYEGFTGLPSTDVEIRIQNQNYHFRALIYSEARTKCISIKLWSMDELDSMLWKKMHCGEIQATVHKLFHEKKVRKIGQKKLAAMEEARKAAERKEKKKQKELARKNNPLYQQHKKAKGKKSDSSADNSDGEEEGTSAGASSSTDSGETATADT